MAQPIAHDRFPVQLPIVGADAVVAFGNDIINVVTARIVRADAEEPHVTVLVLEDGRAVLGSECVFTPVTITAPTMTPAMVEPTRKDLEAQIADLIAEQAGPDGEPVSGGAWRTVAQSIAEDALGPDWAFTIHHAHGKRPQVFVTRYVGEFAPA